MLESTIRVQNVVKRQNPLRCPLTNNNERVISHQLLLHPYGLSRFYWRWKIVTVYVIISIMSIVKIITFEENKDRVSVVQKGRTLKVTMQCTNVAYVKAQADGKSEDELDKLRWTEETLSFLTALLDVYDDKSVSLTYLSDCSRVKNKAFACIFINFDTIVVLLLAFDSIFLRW